MAPSCGYNRYLARCSVHVRNNMLLTKALIFCNKVFATELSHFRSNNCISRATVPPSHVLTTSIKTYSQTSPCSVTTHPRTIAPLLYCRWFQPLETNTNTNPDELYHVRIAPVRNIFSKSPNSFLFVPRQALQYNNYFCLAWLYGRCSLAWWWLWAQSSN